LSALIPSWKKWLLTGLEEDGAAFDWTARSLSTLRPDSNQTSARLVSKANGIWAGATGLKALALLSRELGSPLEIETSIEDGARIVPGQTLCTWRGAARSIVMFERTFINLASYTSGIASQTRTLVDRVLAAGMKHPVRITATRKTLPGYRDLAIEATLIGGAHPHRFNLSGGLLLKENHIAAAGGITAAVKSSRNTIPHLLKIEIEVRNQEELKEAISAGAEVIMLDNFTPDQIRAAVPLKPEGVCFEASGGITLSNLDTYLIEGLDVISVGALTHSVKAVDLSLLMIGT
jgi:nicotinate-nucleotide pyrophosphorylase (carboxylating)